MDDLGTLLLDRMPGVCGRCQAFWRALAESAPHTLTATECARVIGYRNRYQLLRWMAQHGYSRFLEVADWVRLIGWLLEAERSRIPLYRQAWASQMEPSVCHRTIRRAAKTTWTLARQQGLQQWLYALEGRFRGTIRCIAPAARIDCDVQGLVGEVAIRPPKLATH